MQDAWRLLIRLPYMAPGVVVFIVMAQTQPSGVLFLFEAAVVVGLLVWGMAFTSLDRQAADGKPRPCTRCIGFDLGLASLAVAALAVSFGHVAVEFAPHRLWSAPLLLVSAVMNYGTYKHWRSCHARKEPTEGFLAFVVGFAFGFLGVGTLAASGLILLGLPAG